MNRKVFTASALTETYVSGEVEVKALRELDLEIWAGEVVVLLGPSGSGKSTLLNIKGGLDHATSGHLFFREQDLTRLNDRGPTAYRRKHVGALEVKLLRDLRRMWAQALAIALVIAGGVTTLVLSVGSHRSLDETRITYYEQYRFADVFAHVRRAPKGVADRIAEIPGVAAVDARITKLALLDIPGFSDSATGQLVARSSIVDPPEIWSQLGHDYRVIVHVTIWSADSAVTVPVSALFRRGEDWAVFSVANGRARTTLVRIGHRNNRLAEVTAGLSPGEQVVMHPSDRIAEGVAETSRERLNER